MYHFHLAHAKDTQGRWFVNLFFVRFPPNHEAIALYLMMNDERFLNSLFSVNLFPSNSTHLLWKRNLESYEYLESCSHQWQALFPSTVGNNSMSLDHWILQVFDTDSSIHTCNNVLGALIPTFIIGRLSRVC
jgi:hypothetical protein